MTALHLGVLLAGAWCTAALALESRRAKAFGTRRLFAPAAGDPKAGALYAFTKGMAPQAKESVRLNPLSYLAGVLYHCGIFTAAGVLALGLAGLAAPKFLAFPALLGAACGLALLAKRLLKAHLRGLSCPDDFLSNLLATVFAALGGASLLQPALGQAFLLSTIALLVYIPTGKIRHCVFFFSTRYHSGAFFGRRGVFPPGPDRH